MSVEDFICPGRTGQGGIAARSKRSVLAIPAQGDRQKSIMHIFFASVILLMTSTVVADELLWQKLRQDPDMVVLMRNSESSGNLDGGNMLVWDVSGKCRGESLLTEQGKAHARRVGQAFTEHGIQPMVISSPMCRCTETARIAFGEYLTDPDLRQSASMDDAAMQALHDKTSTLLSRYRGKTPIVLVNHRPNIDSLTMELLEIGDLLVGSITDTGEIEVAGRIRIEP